MADYYDLRKGLDKALNDLSKLRVDLAAMAQEAATARQSQGAAVVHRLAANEARDAAFLARDAALAAEATARQSADAAQLIIQGLQERTGHLATDNGIIEDEKRNLEIQKNALVFELGNVRRGRTLLRNRNGEYRYDNDTLAHANQIVTLFVRAWAAAPVRGLPGRAYGLTVAQERWGAWTRSTRVKAGRKFAVLDLIIVRIGELLGGPLTAVERAIVRAEEHRL